MFSGERYVFEVNVGLGVPPESELAFLVDVENALAQEVSLLVENVEANEAHEAVGYKLDQHLTLIAVVRPDFVWIAAPANLALLQDFVQKQEVPALLADYLLSQPVLQTLQMDRVLFGAVADVVEFHLLVLLLQANSAQELALLVLQLVQLGCVQKRVFLHEEGLDDLTGSEVLIRLSKDYFLDFHDHVSESKDVAAVNLLVILFVHSLPVLQTAPLDFLLHVKQLSVLVESNVRVQNVFLLDANHLVILFVYQQFRVRVEDVDFLFQTLQVHREVEQVHFVRLVDVENQVKSFQFTV